MGGMTLWHDLVPLASLGMPWALHPQWAQGAEAEELHPGMCPSPQAIIRQHRLCALPETSHLSSVPSAVG